MRTEDAWDIEDRVSDMRDLWEADIELAGTPAKPIRSRRRPKGAGIWSDLHLGDRGTLEAFDRPWRAIEQMNTALLRRWRGREHPRQVVVCPGV